MLFVHLTDKGVKVTFTPVPVTALVRETQIDEIQLLLVGEVRTVNGWSLLVAPGLHCLPASLHPSASLGPSASNW
jgi:hypothetical protein